MATFFGQFTSHSQYKIRSYWSWHEKFKYFYLFLAVRIVFLRICDQVFHNTEYWLVGLLQLISIRCYIIYSTEKLILLHIYLNTLNHINLYVCVDVVHLVFIMIEFFLNMFHEENWQSDKPMQIFSF